MLVMLTVQSEGPKLHNYQSESEQLFGIQVLSLDCNPAETNRAASSGADRSLKLWDLHLGLCMRDFVDVTKTCNSLCFTSEGQVL